MGCTLGVVIWPTPGGMSKYLNFCSRLSVARPSAAASWRRSFTAATAKHFTGAYAMAVVTVPAENRTLTELAEIREYLAPHGIWHERWQMEDRVNPDATAEEILAAYAPEVRRLMDAGGYTTADVINV